MENIFELVDKKLKKLREAEAQSVSNTSDETNLEKIVIQLPVLINRLKKFDQIVELDGLFKAILEQTSLKDVSKQTIMDALRRALKEMEPDSPTVTTKKEK